MNDYLKALVERAQGFQWDAPPEEIVADQEQAVASDAFDHLAWDMLQDAAPNLRESIKNVAEEHDYVAPAYEDLFNLLHQGDPMFNDERTMKEGYAANHQMLGQMAETNSFQDLRAQTAHDEWTTAFAMLSMEDEMKEAFERVRDAREAAMDAQAEAVAGQGALGEAVAGAQDPNADPTQAAATLEQAMADMAQAQANLDAAQQQQQASIDEATNQLEDAAQTAKQELDDERQRASAWGLDPGELKRMSFEERRALTAKLNSDKMRRLANLVGAFRQFADAERRRKVQHAMDDIADVKHAADLRNMIPDEFNRLAMPELEDLFWIGYAQESLLTWDKEGTENLGQGPIIVVCDESGSMDQELSGGNTREMWSKALSLALCDQARRNKRDFIYIGFASSGQQFRLDFPNGETPLAQVIEFVEHFFDGGTSYAEPLTMAKNIVTEYEAAGKEKPDVVFITDDDCRVAEKYVTEWREVKDRLDMNCYGIQVGGSVRDDSAMNDLCDKTINLSALNANPDGMQELFRTI